MIMLASGSSENLHPMERVVLEAVGARLDAEPRERLRAQVEQLRRIHRPRVFPELSLLSAAGSPASWSAESLFPRRDEFLLAVVELRADAAVHRCEVVAMNGRVFALVTSPSLPRRERGLEVVGVSLGADPMDPRCTRLGWGVRDRLRIIA